MKQVLRAGIALVSACILAAPASAQQVSPPPARPRAAILRDIGLVFLNQVTREMALSADQVPRFQKIVAAWAQKRAVLEADERRLRQSLAGELRPGIAANPDSVARFVDALNDNRVEYATSFRDEMRELVPILTPVQRGQFEVARDRMLQRIRDLQQQRQGRGGRPI